MIDRLHRRRRAALLTIAGVVVSAAAGAFAAPSATATAPAPVSDPASSVDPFIGTKGAGNTFPGADAPFGMVQWGPDTTSRPVGGGYRYSDSAISGFSLTHLSGPGCAAAGDVPVLPTIGAVNPAATDSFSHSAESAAAGRYSVGLANGVMTELTATPRTGLARFTFPSTTQANLIFKLSGSQNGDSATSFTELSDTEVTGSVTTQNFCGTRTNYTLHFDMVFDHPFITSGTYASPAGGYVTFDTTAGQVVQAKVGLSYVSSANAAANLAAESPGWDFAAVQTATHQAWNRLLGRIQIAGGDAATQQVFYTALYHALLHPNVFSDANGDYQGVDGKVHTVDAGHGAFYTNFSGWDIYRSQAQLEALVDPAAASDTAQSMLDDYAQDHMLPKWIENTGETYIQVGDPADPVLADYYAFGAGNFDTKTALADMLAEATQTNNVRPGLNYLTEPGYLPVNGSYGCCHFYGPIATQLEYDTADFAISAFADALGDSSDAQAMASRAQNWQNVLNPATGFIQAKNTDGQLLPGFDATSQYGLVEGDAYQYTLMVPFNLAGLAHAMGGPAKFTSYLDQFFTQINGSRNSRYAAMSNEPSIETPWEYDYVGQPYKTQQVVRQIETQLYTDTPAGLAGNDDLGTMSAWYVFAALGMYPETPGTADLALGSPLFPSATVHLASGAAITINAPQAAPDKPYVQNLRLDGRGWPNNYLPPSVIQNGATLDYTLGATPNTAWGSGALAAPPSYRTGEEPAIAFTDPTSVVSLSPGETTTAQIGAQSEIGRPQAVTWTASSSSPDVTVTPAHGTFRLGPGATAGQRVTLAAAAGASPPATVTVHLTSSTGATLTSVLLTWPAPGQFSAYGCPPTAQFEHVVPHAQMTATATSYQSGNSPSAAIDDNCNTFWHTEYSPVRASLPQSITLDLGGSYGVDALTYVPRQDGNANGDITG